MGSLESGTLMPANMQILTCHQPSACSWWRCRGCSLIVKSLPRKNSRVRCTAIHLHAANTATSNTKVRPPEDSSSGVETASPLRRIGTLKLQTFRDVSVHSHKLVHGSGTHCHVHASSTSGRAFVYFTV